MTSQPPETPDAATPVTSAAPGPDGPPAGADVLRAGGLDPEEWTGFYINIGLDRLVMMRYGIDDVRLFNGADLRFLAQFK